MNEGTVGLVLAAGAGSRFGGGKLLAPIGGRPVLQHVLDALATAGVGEVVVVLGRDAEAVEAAIAWRGERRVVNPEPERGLRELAPGRIRGRGSEGRRGPRRARRPAARVGRGDPLAGGRAGQARSADRRAGLCGRARTQSRPAPPGRVRAGRGGGGRSGPRTGPRGAPGARRRDRGRRARTPMSTRPPISSGDRGRLGGARPGQPRPGRPDPRGPRRAGLLRAGPVALPGRSDPDRRSGPGRAARARPVRARLARRRRGRRPLRAADRARARPVGRLRRRARRVAVDARGAARDRRGLRDRERPDGRGALAAGRRPAASDFEADVALIAHVGYDIEAIGPFIDALEGAAGRLCVAVLMERVPASAADPFWPPVHGEERVRCRRCRTSSSCSRRGAAGHRSSGSPFEPRRFESRDALEGFVRRQLWIDPAGPKEARFQAALDELAVPDGDGWTIKGRGPGDVGIVTWAPR